MRDLAREGMTMLVVTHEMQFAREVGDRVVFMDEGRIIEEGVPADVLDRPRQERTQRFLRRSLQLAGSLEELSVTPTRKEHVHEEDSPGHGGGRRLRGLCRDDRLRPAHGRDRADDGRRQAPAPLPKLPADIANRKRLIVGVKCDTPPFGYLDVRGKNAGVDVEIAKWFARYAFGREQRLSFVCAPTAVREPLLTGGRVDLVISTFTYTADRDTRIDFSRAYYNATGRLLVKNNSPIQSLADIRGRKVATTPGSIYDRWMRRCFPNTPRCSRSRASPPR